MRGGARKRWATWQQGQSGTRPRKTPSRIAPPISVSPRYAGYLDRQRERLKAEALGRLGKSSGTADATGS